MKYPFGKDFTHTFYPTIDNEPISLVSQAASVFLFSEAAKPATVAAAQVGTGATGSEITYWTQSSSSPYGCAFTVPKIEDPDPDSSTDTIGYWLAINFIIQAGATKQTVLQHIDLQRVRTTDAVPGVTATDLKEYYPAITSYLTDSQLATFITLAQDETRIELESKGFNWASIFSLSKLALPIAFKTIALATLSQIREPGDKHELRFNTFNDKYDAIMKALTLEHDTDEDGDPDANMKPRTTYAVIAR